MNIRNRNSKLGASKWKLLPTSWSYQTKEFFEKSTLHGVRYIAESNRPIYERLMWFVLTSMGSVITLMIIFSLWEKFQTNPTITGLDTDFHNWDVPFPAVTICPLNPVNNTLLEEYVLKKWGNDLSEEKMEYYKSFVMQIALLSYSNFANISRFTGDKTLPQDNFRRLLSEVRLSCDDLVYNCQWKDADYNCCEGFLPIHTENGFCYSFNSLQAFLESGKTTDPPNVQYIYETDSKWSIIFSLKTELKNHVKVFVHSSEESPSLDMDPQLVWMRQISKVFFSSKHTYTTEDARQLSIKQRRCIYFDERDLLTHTKYSYTACMIQCRMETARRLCGCVPTFYKKINGFRYCDLAGLACLSKYIKDLGRGMSCPCELGCENTVYEVEKLVDAMDKREPLEVGFVSWPMVRYKREVLFGWVDLLVSFGGIAGLFLGFSLLTGVEIIYYFTMRALCMVHHNTDELLQLYNSSDNGNKDTNNEFNNKIRNITNEYNDIPALRTTQMGFNAYHNKALATKNIKSDEIFTLPFLN